MLCSFLSFTHLFYNVLVTYKIGSGSGSGTRRQVSKVGGRWRSGTGPSPAGPVPDPKYSLLQVRESGTRRQLSKVGGPVPDGGRQIFTAVLDVG